MSDHDTQEPIDQPMGSAHSSGHIMGRARKLMDVDNIASVVLAAVAVEGFLVELVSSAANAHPALVSECRQLAVLGECLGTEPGEKASSQFRFQLARLALAGSPFDRGAEPFRGLDVLIRLRHRLVHPLPEPVTTAGFRRGNGAEQIVRYLETNHLVRDDEAHGRVESRSLLALADSPDVSRWACRTAAAVRQALVNSIPPSVFRRRYEFLGHPWTDPVPD